MTLLFVSLVLVLLMAFGQSIAVSMGVTGMVYFLLTNGLDYFPMVVTRIFQGDGFLRLYMRSSLYPGRRPR